MAAFVPKKAQHGRAVPPLALGAEAMAGGSLSWGPSPAAVMALVALLYWHISEVLGRSPGACPACACDCDALPLLQLPQGKEYNKGDSRYIARDTATITIEGITAVLKGPASLLAVGQHTKELNLSGNVVLQGFIDSHVHLINGGMQLARVPLRGVRTKDDFISRVKGAVKGRDGSHQNWSCWPRRHGAEPCPQHCREWLPHLCLQQDDLHTSALYYMLLVSISFAANSFLPLVSY